MLRMETGQALKYTLRGTAITALLFAAAVAIPFFGIIAVLVIPVPVLLHRLKLGRLFGAIVPAVAFLFWLGQIGAMTVDLFLFLAQLVMGFSLAEFLARRLSIEKTIGYAAGMVLLVGVCTLLMYSSSAGLDMGKFISDAVEANLAFYREVSNSLDIPEDQRQSLSDAFELVHYVVVRILPGLCIAAALFGAWISLLLARPFLKAGQADVPHFERLNRWKAPELLVWGLIGFSAMMLIPEMGIKLVGLNGLIVVLQIYFFQGIAIVSFYFEKKRLPAAMKWFLYSLIALQVFALVLVICLGIFDMWLDFRRLKQPTETNGVS